jgi:tetratricopeptide (TPR) repeat protein
MRALAPETIRIIDKHLELHPDDVRATYFLAAQWSIAGERDKALALGRQALALAPNEPGVRYNVACLFANEGMSDEALDLIEGNMKFGWGNAEWLLHDPDMEPLRDLPRFRALLEKMPARRNPAATS